MTAPTRRHPRPTTGATAVVAGLAAALALLLGASGCTAESPARPAGEEPTLVLDSGRPHFEGQRAVTVQAGRIVYSGQTCDPVEGRGRVCSLDGERTYLAFGKVKQVTLTEARMEPADGNTTWTASLRFAPEDRRAVRRSVAEATASGAVVLILDENQVVLLPTPVTEFFGARVLLENLTKQQAWDVVARFDPEKS